MTNYDTDEIDRESTNYNRRMHPDTSNAVRQWDEDSQSYITVKNHEYEDEEVTNPKHYDKVGFAIQPIEYITKNELDFLEGNVIKYVSRYQHKGGIKDLLKARTYVDFLITRERERNE